jgi:hypothetical protein
MRYALLYFETPAEIAKRGSAEEAPAYWGAWSRYIAMLGDALQNGAALQPPDMATNVRRTGGEVVIEDGPFADSREELGGFVIVEAANLDEAVKLAEAAPCAEPGAGWVEVRPLVPMPAETATVPDTEDVAS